MTVNEARRKLRYAVNELGQTFTPQQMNEMRKALKIAEDAMDKQKQMKPIKLTDDGELYACPVCDETLFSSCKPCYCNICGQKLDWSNEDV